ncbi:MAG: homocysteine biosynthesis protein [bacterium]
MKTYEELNEKIKQGKAVVVTADEVCEIAEKDGVKTVAEKVDVVTTATFGPMCSSGILINVGHSDPPIKMHDILLNDVPAYAGLAAVDAYLGATALSESKGLEYGGGNVIEDLLSGKSIHLKVKGHKTDCYPAEEVEAEITLQNLNQATLLNPRNAYQNYTAATNSSHRTLYTYMGALLPRFGNVAYSTSGQLNPLINDPDYRTIGLGTKIFLGGGIGYVLGAGTQHNPCQVRAANKVPLSSAGTLMLMGDLKQMNPRYLRGANINKYGVSLFVGIGIPIPVLDEGIAASVSVQDKDIYTTIYDYSVERLSRPTYGRVSYQNLRSGSININGNSIATNPVSSLFMAREIASILKEWIQRGDFFLVKPIEFLPQDTRFKPLPQKDKPKP